MFGKKKTTITEKDLEKAFIGVTLTDVNEAFNELSKEEQLKLKQAAKELQSNPMFEWLHKEMVQIACKKTFLDSKSMDDLLFGKACLYMEDIRQKKIDNLEI